MGGTKKFTTIKLLFISLSLVIVGSLADTMRAASREEITNILSLSGGYSAQTDESQVLHPDAYDFSIQSQNDESGLTVFSYNLPPSGDINNEAYSSFIESKFLEKDNQNSMK